MEQWQEMQSYVGFDDPDALILRELAPRVASDLPWLADRFYEEIDRHPEALAVIRDAAQRARLHQTLQRWIKELLEGPHDAAYWERRRRIGRTHVRVGLPARFMFTAMNRLRVDLSELARTRLSGDRSWEACHALMKVMDMELAVMTGSYMGAHEADALRDLQAAIIRSLPVTVLCIDQDGVVVASTRASAHIFGCPEHGGGRMGDYLPPELIDKGRLHTHVQRAIQARREVTVPRVVLGEGLDTRTFRVTVVPLGHDLAEVLLHVEELTDVIQAEARARQAETLARIGSLAANMAHEIRNPLAAISATLQVITRSLGDDDRRRVILGKVQEQVHRLDRLVSDLLGYARPAEARLEELNLEELAREAVAQAGVDAEVSVGAAEEGLGDRQLVQHVLINLLQNARDAAGQGAVRVVVGPGSQLAVEDAGPGVPPDEAGRIFEAFVTTKTRGTGLGLAICRKMAEAMGAWVGLDPAGSPLGGARFVLRLREPLGEEGP